jgi:hypothetical protein
VLIILADISQTALSYFTLILRPWYVINVWLKGENGGPSTIVNVDHLSILKYLFNQLHIYHVFSWGGDCFLLFVHIYSSFLATHFFLDSNSSIIMPSYLAPIVSSLHCCLRCSVIIEVPHNDAEFSVVHSFKVALKRHSSCLTLYNFNGQNQRQIICFCTTTNIYDCDF